MTPSRLVVTGVSQRYGHQVVLHDVSFELSDGVTGLLGSNGAGKSTLMRCLAGVIPWHQGVITIDGIDAGRHPRSARRLIGYMPERAGIPPELRVEELIRIAAAAKRVERGRRETEVERVLVDADLIGQRHRVIGNLSKGFRQRVVLAQALLGEPAVLVLDEPTSGIDAETLENFYRVLDAYGRHHAVLLSTHVADEVRTLCDRTLVMVDGRITEARWPVCAQEVG